MHFMIVLLVLFVVYWLVIYLFFLYVFSRKIKVDMEKFMPDGYASILEQRKNRILSYPMEEVRIESFDGLQLYGRYFHKEGHDKLVVMCHGWKSPWYVDFSKLAIWFYEQQNCDMLIMDERAGGKSEGKYVTFGLYERKDIHDWVMWAKDKQELPIYLYGTSMGAATVLMVASSVNDIVSGIIADSPFLEPYAELKDFAKRNIHLPEFPFLPSLNCLVKLLMKTDLKSVNALSSIQSAAMPILIFHGDLDFFCNVAVSKNIRDLHFPNISVHIYPDANHCSSYAKHEKEYENIIENFIK